MVNDRVKGDQVCLTQEFLGHMLGIGRARVALAAEAFPHDALIAHKRGIITLTDRGVIEATACECYQRMRDEYYHRCS
jgi:hypothetical protein